MLIDLSSPDFRVNTYMLEVRFRLVEFVTLILADGPLESVEPCRL